MPDPWPTRLFDRLPRLPDWFLPVCCMVLLVALGFILGMVVCTQRTADDATRQIHARSLLEQRVQALEQRLTALEDPGSERAPRPTLTAAEVEQVILLAPFLHGRAYTAEEAQRCVWRWKDTCGEDPHRVLP